MSKKSFKIICRKCGREVILEDYFTNPTDGIKIGFVDESFPVSFALICECGNQIEELD